MFSTVHQENDRINQQARQNCDSSIKKQTENTCYVCCGELVCVLYLFVCASPQPPCSEAASVAGAKRLLPQLALGKPQQSMGLAAENGARL